jgi:hypothetical protein
MVPTRFLSALGWMALLSWRCIDAAKLRSTIENIREMKAKFYHVVPSSTLGRPNPQAAIGNPLKGLVESPIYTNPPYTADIPIAVEFYYVGEYGFHYFLVHNGNTTYPCSQYPNFSGLNEIMKGNPARVGEAAAFDWSVLDNYLSGSASRNMHAVWRVILDFPGQPLKVPQYLLDAGVEIRWYSGGSSPYYGDPKLVEALQQFITYCGKRYDGDKRLGFIQAGLLGFWGEWHTGSNEFLPASTEESMISWYT